jgi:hypothetical protein
MGGQVTTAYCVIANYCFTPPLNCPPGEVSDGLYLQQGGGHYFRVSREQYLLG